MRRAFEQKNVKIPEGKIHPFPHFPPPKMVNDGNSNMLWKSNDFQVLCSDVITALRLDTVATHSPIFGKRQTFLSSKNELQAVVIYTCDLYLDYSETHQVIWEQNITVYLNYLQHLLQNKLKSNTKQVNRMNYSLNLKWGRNKLGKKQNSGPQESLGSPKSLTVPASRLLSYLPSLSSQAYASSGLFGCHATVKVGDSHWISHSFSPTAITPNMNQPVKHKSSFHHHFKMLLLTCLYFSNVNEMVLGGGRQHFTIVTETKRPHRPV